METAALTSQLADAARSPARADAARPAPAAAGAPTRPRRLRDPAAREQALGQLGRGAGRRRARVEARRQAVPAISYPADLPVSQRKDEIAAAIRDHQVVIVAGETGSGQDHPAAQDLPGARPRRHRPDRPHPAAADRGPHRGRADRRGARHRARHGGRLQGAVHRQVQRRHAGQGDDGRHPAGRDAAGPAAAAVRHADHRRGARAQPEHRLHPRLPEAAAAQPARPQGHHHLGHDRPGAVRGAFGRRRIRQAELGCAGDRGVGADLPGRGALPAAGRPGPARTTSRATRSQGICDARDRATRRRPRRHPGLPQRRAGDPGHRRRAGRRPAGPGGAAAVRPAVRGRAAPGVPAAPPAGGWCWPPTSPRPR